MSQKKLLLVEDDLDLGATLSDNLQLEGYWVDWQKEGDKALHAATKNQYDLILLDLMLPKVDGLEILKEVRKKSEVPIMILSAKSQLQDRIETLELQADDYLTKPFHLKELFLRIENLIRRGREINKKILDEFVIGNAKINLQKQIIVKNNCKEDLSETETKTLLYFYLNRNSFLSRDDIMNYVWGYSKNINTRTIDNMILKFRKIIEDRPATPKYFISKRSLGYSLQITED